MKKYNIIYTDPPWHYGSKSAVNNTKSSEIKPLSDHYPTMRLKELKAIPVRHILADDAACFMWVPDSHLDEALEVMKEWGFKYKTIAFNWVKITATGKYCKNVAPWTMKSIEICLLGTKGAMTKHKKSNNINAMVFAERTKHSKKPDEVRHRIEALFGDLPRVELFCRYPAQGWDVWGNEVESDESITKALTGKPVKPLLCEANMKDLCLNCGQELESELWGGKCTCDAPNVVHQEKCMGCGRVVGQITDDDYCGPEKLYCPDCMDNARKHITRRLHSDVQKQRCTCQILTHRHCPIHSKFARR